VTIARSIRTLAIALVLALSAVAALSFAGSASAATKCGEKVLNDWYDNGRIDRLYPLHCYEEAIDAIPNDIGPYVDAEDVINRALQGALNNNVVNGGCDPSADGSADDCTGTGGGKNPPNSDGTSDGTAAPDVDTSSSSSVPIPLVVLGGMSLLLLAAGAAGYLSRRRQAAHADEFDDSGNPPV
jgi:hypothetical protein